MAAPRHVPWKQDGIAQGGLLQHARSALKYAETVYSFGCPVTMAISETETGAPPPAQSRLATGVPIRHRAFAQRFVVTALLFTCPATTETLLLETVALQHASLRAAGTAQEEI